MLTVDALTQLAGPALCFADHNLPDKKDREVLGMWPADLFLPDPPTRESLSGIVLLISSDAAWMHDPDTLIAALRTAAALDAEALLLVPRAGHHDKQPQVLALLRRAAREAGLPLLALSRSEAAIELLEQLRHRCQREANVDTEHLEAMLTAVRHFASGPADTAGDLVAAAGASVQGTAVLVQPDGTLVGAGNRPDNSGLGGLDDLVARLRAGGPGPVSAQDESAHIQLHAAGITAPHPVLIARRPSAFNASQSRLLQHAAATLGVQHHLAALHAQHGRSEQLAERMRMNIFRQLMDSCTERAQEDAAYLLEELASCTHVQIYLLQGPRRDRDALAARCHRELGHQCLVIKCPAYVDHLIIVAPIPEVGHTQHVLHTLQTLTKSPQWRNCLLSESRAVPIARTAWAYGEALRALAAARSLPGRTATAPGTLSLTQVLTDDARQWAAQFLRPLFDLPPDQRQSVASLVGNALAFGPGEAARMASPVVHRNTAIAHRRDTAARLGVELGSLGDCAVLALALELVTFPADPPPDGPAPSLHAVLDTPACRTWAAQFLAPLDSELRRTLTQWVAADGKIGPPLSRALDLHPNTIRKYLGRCEEVIPTQLFRNRTGAFQAALALHILTELPMPDYARPARTASRAA
ncbi:hypothetical protein [Streptomyces sp. NBC_01304]|uniref:hypothetical protein n=1 Tax=Streptomyces sp. NBC_01304 TaxID=2903818 RepID=UPI002E0DFC6B|nr:hypothetical protein OG430_41465 [Streptomyces sp. NBC_01304]